MLDPVSLLMCRLEALKHHFVIAKNSLEVMRLHVEIENLELEIAKSITLRTS